MPRSCLYTDRVHGNMPSDSQLPFAAFHIATTPTWDPYISYIRINISYLGPLYILYIPNIPHYINITPKRDLYISYIYPIIYPIWDPYICYIFTQYTPLYQLHPHKGTSPWTSRPARVVRNMRRRKRRRKRIKLKAFGQSTSTVGEENVNRCEFEFGFSSGDV